MLCFTSMSVFKVTLILFVCIVTCVHSYSTDKTCDPVDQLRCDDGFCIEKLQWCDTIVDCRDNSDEMYCNGVVPCQAIHFECANKKCIPASAICDDFDDCHDNSDEKNCNSSIWQDDDVSLGDIFRSSSSQNFTSIPPTDFSSVKQVVIDKAVKYLLNKNSEYGWDTFTPRAVVALSMASRVSPIAAENMQVMLKQLNIHILQDLMKNRNVSLSSLALYVNALHATCQDPRDFQGINLVARLRSETNSAMKSNTSIPLVFLTLCLSNATRPEDNYKLAEMYNSIHFGTRTGSRALIMLAMSCIMHKDNTGIFGEYMSDFFYEEIKKVQISDIYTQALFSQASIAAGFPYPVELSSKQLPDGSFGDVLSTYYAIPVLLNASLLDLVCRNQSKKSIFQSDLGGAEGRNEISYSLWITPGKDPITHSITIPFYGKKSLFDIMAMIASRDPLYRFLYEDSEQDGKMVYSLAGIPNDIESGMSWSLYIADTDSLTVNSADGLIPLDEGVDKYFPGDKDHIIFWFKRNLITN